MRGHSAQRQQRGLSLLAGKRLALVGCCLAATVPTLSFHHHPHAGETPEPTLLCGGEGRCEGAAPWSPWSPAGLCAPHAPGFQLGRGRRREGDAGCQGGGVSPCLPQDVGRGSKVTHPDFWNPARPSCPMAGPPHLCPPARVGCAPRSSLTLPKKWAEGLPFF